MKVILPLACAVLVSALAAQAETIEIEGSQYRFEYDAKAWNFLPLSTGTQGLWVFSDHLLFLGGVVMRLDSGTDDGITARAMIQDIHEEYEKVEKPKYVLVVFVEGDGTVLTLRRSMVREFLGGVRKKP